MKNTSYITLAILISFLFSAVTAAILNNDHKQDNAITFEWEGLEKDIPTDGSYIQISGKVNNVVYLNAIDE